MKKRGAKPLVFKTLGILVSSAFLAAISIVCGKYLAIPGGDILRFSFENMPILFAGIAFGPIIGAVVGAVADLIGCVLVGYTINPLVTVGAAAVGLVGGSVYYCLSLIKRCPYTVKIAASVALGHIVGSVLIKTLGLAAFYGIPLWALMLWRLLNYVIVGALEGAILWLLLKNRLIISQINSLFRGKPGRHGTPRVKNREVAHMTYEKALEYIHGTNRAFCKPGLERIEHLCEGLGHPERGMKFVHVGGTNGKGSFCSMLDSVLRAAGYKVGLYTSPYIVEFGERIRVNGENIPGDTLAEITERVKHIADAMADKPTEFELITAIAFEYFRQEGVDVVVLEVGLGGRLDSTNIIRDPLVSVITGIALDHTAILGDTIEKIATEKAGIIKDGAPVLYGGEDDVAREVIHATAEARGSEYTDVDYSHLEIWNATLEGTELNYREHSGIKISLLGAYQPRNAAVVLEAVGILRARGMEISEDAVRRGLSEARWPARFEVISREPLVIFDGAHNPQGIDGAVESIKRYFGDNKVYALSGVLRDKDYERIATALATVTSRAFTITPDNPRALSAEEYAEVLRARGVDATPAGSIDEAVRAAVAAAKQNGVPLVCLGSLYTYGDVIRKIKQ